MFPAAFAAGHKYHLELVLIRFFMRGSLLLTQACYDAMSPHL